MFIFLIVLGTLIFLGINVIFIKYFYWGPGGKAPTPEDEAREKAQPPPTTRPKW